MIKVLVFGMTETPGGVESVIMNYYRHIDRTRIQFDFLCNSYEKVAYEAELLALGGHTFHFPARSKNYPRYRLELKCFFREHAAEYAVIWVNICSLANIDYLKLAAQYGIPKRIIHSHSSANMDGRLRGLLHQHNKKQIGRFATDFWACSAEAAGWFYPSEICSQAVILHNAIDVQCMAYDENGRENIRRQLGWQNQFVIGNIGRLHFEKNQRFALEVMAALVRKDRSVRLVLVGQGEDESELREQIFRKGLQEYVYRAGVQSNIRDWLSSFDLFLFPSVFEGLPVAAMEAQANGVPVLASEDVIPDEVRMNKNIKMLSLQQPPEIWAEAVCEMKEWFVRENPEDIWEHFIQSGYEIEHVKDEFEQRILGEKA